MYKMELLTNKNKISKILQVAIGYNEEQFDVFIREAQDFDLKPILCEDFYYELIENNSDNSVWQKLLEGGVYEHNGSEKQFRGVLDVLAYFTYARFILKSNYVSTSHGFSIKKTPHSEPMQLEEKRNMYYKYRQEAEIIFKDVKLFVERNISNYASWNACAEKCNESGLKPRFTTTVIQ